MGVEGLVSKFKDVEDMGFQRYLDDKRPYFVMSHDGRDAKDTRGPILELLKKLIDIGQNVALINECVFVDSKVFTISRKTILAALCADLSFLSLDFLHRPSNKVHPRADISHRRVR